MNDSNFIMYQKIGYQFHLDETSVSETNCCVNKKDIIFYFKQTEIVNGLAVLRAILGFAVCIRNLFLFTFI